jgi:cytochrome c oxidase cbb3-type subunit 3
MRRSTRIMLIAVGGAAILVSACRREHRGIREEPAPPPGGKNPYGNNSWAVSEGAQLFQWFNCAGCHASHGGGGIGPALMDSQWRYGQSPTEVFNSIAEGRPNGMPSFRNRLTDQQIWQLVNYVLSLSGQLRFDARAGRQDGMNPGASPTPPPAPEGAKRGGKEP